MKTLVLIFILNVSLTRSVPMENASELMRGRVIKGDVNLMQKNKAAVNDLFESIKKLKSKRSQDEIGRIATLGILAGALKVERDMNEHLAEMTRDFFINFNSSTPQHNMEKLYKLEETMERDMRAMEILGNALDFAIHTKTYEEYKEDMDKIGKSNEISMLELAKKKFSTQMTSEKTPKGEKVGKLLKHSDDLRSELNKRMNDVRSSINKHMYTVHTTLKERERKVVKYFSGKRNAPATIKPAVDVGFISSVIQPKTTMYDSVTDATTDYTNSIGYETFPPSEKESRLAGLLNRLKRQDNNSQEDQENNVDGAAMSGEKESESESESEEGPTGLVGLIANLSGGDEGSDVGAIIGALTGVVTNLFGPNGLDVPSLLGTGTSLLAGLLAGDENFGKVLGTYVGVAVDGLSGGGGAALNGQFFGQFLGTVLSQLSADPDDEELPAKPIIFLQNFFSGSKQATSKAGEEDTKDAGHKPSHGSDFFGFITNVISSIVGGLTSIILNTSLGSSGGSSQGSADLSGGSSAASSSSHPKPDTDQYHH